MERSRVSFERDDLRGQKSLVEASMENAIAAGRNVQRNVPNQLNLACSSDTGSSDPFEPERDFVVTLQSDTTGKCIHDQNF